MLKKICSNCGRTIDQGTSCPCRHHAYDKIQRDQSKVAFYHSKDWRRIVEYVQARANGLDEYLLANGQIIKGNVVHHIYTIDERPDLKLVLENLICVSNATHNFIHAEYDKSLLARRIMQEKLLRIRSERKKIYGQAKLLGQGDTEKR